MSLRFLLPRLLLLLVPVLWATPGLAQEAQEAQEAPAINYDYIGFWYSLTEAAAGEPLVVVREALPGNEYEQKKQAETLAAKLQDKVVAITKRVGDENRLFGSVTSADIAAALQDAGVAIDRKAIILPDAIKALGEYKVAVKTGYQTTATILVQVVPEDMVPIQ